MFQKKKIILSYDYELFFGDRSGTVMKTLIQPTNLLLDAMDSVGVKGNFFVDWQMLKYLKKANTERTDADLKLIVDQLKDMVRRGHRIELHIHPHWVDAKSNGDGTWDFSEFHHYSLHSFSEEEIVEMFVEGTNLLTSIAREVDPEYKIVAFRAGGWAVQPFDKLKKGFIAAGIKVDSSVMQGIYATHKESYYDFRNAPNKPIYRFSNNVCQESENGEFLEVPISIRKRVFANRIFNFIVRKTTNRFSFVTDGTHFRSKDAEFEAKQIISKERNSRRGVMMLREAPINMPINIYHHPADLICYIEHPKDFTRLTCGCIKAIGKTSQVITYKDLM